MTRAPTGPSGVLLLPILLLCSSAPGAQAVVSAVEPELAAVEQPAPPVLPPPPQEPRDPAPVRAPVSYTGEEGARHIAQPVDTDADPGPDRWVCDMDGDGRTDVTGFDPDGDGVPEAWDTDADGRTDYWQWSTRGDGQIDAEGYDADNDGRPDQFFFDDDHNGTFEMGESEGFDRDGDGASDTWRRGSA